MCTSVRVNTHLLGQHAPATEPGLARFSLNNRICFSWITRSRPQKTDPRTRPRGTRRRRWRTSFATSASYEAHLDPSPASHPSARFPHKVFLGSALVCLCTVFLRPLEWNSVSTAASWLPECIAKRSYMHSDNSSSWSCAFKWSQEFWGPVLSRKTQ